MRSVIVDVSSPNNVSIKDQLVNRFWQMTRSLQTSHSRFLLIRLMLGIVGNRTNPYYPSLM